MNQIILYDVFVLLCTVIIGAERGQCATKSDPFWLAEIEKHHANVFQLIPVMSRLLEVKWQCLTFRGI